jgi:hypothetical protein
MSESAFIGTIKERLERKFTVIKERDLQEHCDYDDYMALNHILAKIERGRKKNNKRPYNSYVVINLDEPYTNEIIEIMKRNGHWGDSNE